MAQYPIPPIYKKVQRVFSFCYVADNVLRSSSGEVIFDKSDQYKYVNSVSFIDEYTLKFIFVFGNKTEYIFIDEDGGLIKDYRQKGRDFHFDYYHCDIYFDAEKNKFKKDYVNLENELRHEYIPRDAHICEFDVGDITYNSKKTYQFEIDYADILFEETNKDPFEDYEDEQDYEEDTYYALGGDDYSRFKENGGNIDDMMDELGY